MAFFYGKFKNVTAVVQCLLLWVVKNDKKFRNLAAGVQGLLLSLFLMIGGVWTFYGFNARLEIQNARASLEKLQRELHEQATLEISIEASQEKSSVEGVYLISGKLTVQNHGSRNSSLHLLNMPIVCALVSFEDGNISYTETATAHIQADAGVKAGNKTMLAGNTDRMPFLAQVAEPGLYLLTFITRRPPEAQRVAEKAGSSVASNFWHAATYVKVE